METVLEETERSEECFYDLNEDSPEAKVLEGFIALFGLRTVLSLISKLHPECVTTLGAQSGHEEDNLDIVQLGSNTGSDQLAKLMQKDVL